MSEQQTQTPLDAVLSPETPQPEAPQLEQQQPVAPERDDEPQVSLLALHRERERRQKMDARVKELEEELQRFNEQRWGLEQEPASAEATARQAEQKRWEDRAFAYNQNFASFVAKHGKDKVAAVDAAIGKLSPQQKAHVIALASGEGDGVEAVAQYVQQLGLLEPAFRPTSLADALSGKKAENGADRSKPEALLPNDFTERERAIHAAERSTTFNASRVEFISEFGKGNFERLDAASQRLLQSDHPAAAEFARAVTAATDPVATAAQLLNGLGLWSPEQTRAPPMPSSFASTRSVNGRSGPAFAGPTPLADIFKR